MYISYDDILETADKKPVWWLYGVPRFKSFLPDDVSVYASQVALVRTKCQACGKRYDVALAGHLRAQLVFTNTLQAGDPPNACDEACVGASMQSEELKVLEFWERILGSGEWNREQKYERKLLDYDGVTFGQPKLPPIHRLPYPDWYDAQKTGDVEAMARFLVDVECELVSEVIEMLEMQRKMDEARRRS